MTMIFWTVGVTEPRNFQKNVENADTTNSVLVILRVLSICITIRHAWNTYTSKLILIIPVFKIEYYKGVLPYSSHFLLGTT